MELAWQTNAWEDYLYWQKTDPKILSRVNELIKDCLRSPFKGIGKPEPLKGNYSGYWSRRINDEHRLVYRISEERLYILQCRFHYK
ncbi:MAG: Txe/YoeB family addiction module toxin [Ginsengibacter sp.]